MNGNKTKIYFALVAVALMLASPLAFSISFDEDSDASAVKARGVVPEANDYQYVIVQDKDGKQITDVKVYDGSAWDSKMPSTTTMNDFWKFQNGVGPFNSFYAAINLYEASNNDDLVEQRINTQLGGIAYVLNPDNLAQTMQGTAYDVTKYNVMLVIPTVYWLSQTVGDVNYLMMSNKADADFSGAASGLAFTDAAASAHTFTDENGNAIAEPYKYIALGVYETSTMSINNQTQAVSMAGKVPTASSSTNNINMHRTWAENGNNDNGYYMVWNLYQWTLYKMMSYTVLGNKDVQYMLGPGNSGQSLDWAATPTGRGGVAASSMTGQAPAAYTNTVANTDNGYYASLFLENSWGSLWEYVDNTYVQAETNNLMAGNYLVFSELNTDTCSDTGVDFASSTNSGKIIDGTNTAVSSAWDIPTLTKNANPAHDGTTINDSAWFNSTIDTVLLVGGNWANGLSDGLAAATADNALGYGTSSVGSRLAYALSADAAEPSDDSSTYTVDIDAKEMVTVRAGNVTLSDGDTIEAGTKLYVTLDSRIPIGEKLIITTYSMLGSPLSFTSSSAIGDELVFIPEGDVFIYLDTGMIESVTYQPIIYEPGDDKTVKEGKEAIEVVLNGSVSNYVWAYERIADSRNAVKQTDSFYFTGDSIVIELDKENVDIQNTGDRYKYENETFTQDNEGAWVKAAVGSTFYVAPGATIYAYDSADTPELAKFVIKDTTLPEGINAASGIAIENGTGEYAGFLAVTVTDATSTNAAVYLPYEQTIYKDWAAGTYYFSLQTDNSYINVVNFAFRIGAYSVTVAEDSLDYIDSITVNGVERYKLNANEVAQIHLNAQAISGLDEYHVFIAYNDEMVEVEPVRAGTYRFVMPAADVEISITSQASGYTIGMMYKYSADSAYSVYIVNNLDRSIPTGTIAAEGYGVVGGKLYDGTKFTAVIHESVFTAVVEGTSASYLIQPLTFEAVEGGQIESLSQITAVVPVYSVTGGETVSGNQYFATGYTKTADNGAMSVKDGRVALLVNEDQVTLADDGTYSTSYQLVVYYNYDISTGESTKTVMDSFQVASGALSQRTNVIVIDYDALGIEKDKVVMYRAYIGSEQVMDVAI